PLHPPRCAPILATRAPGGAITCQGLLPWGTICSSHLSIRSSMSCLSQEISNDIKLARVHQDTLLFAFLRPTPPSPDWQVLTTAEPFYNILASTSGDSSFNIFL